MMVIMENITMFQQSHIVANKKQMEISEIAKAKLHTVPMKPSQIMTHLRILGLK